MTGENPQTSGESDETNSPIAEIPPDVVARSGLLDAEDIEVVEREDGLLLRPVPITYAGP